MIFRKTFICVMYQNNFDGVVSVRICKGYKAAYQQLIELYHDDEVMEPDRGLDEPPSLAEFKRELKRNQLRYKFSGYHYEAEFVRPVNG